MNTSTNSTMISQNVTTLKKDLVCSFYRCTYNKPTIGSFGPRGTHSCARSAKSYTTTSRLTTIPVDVILIICSFVPNELEWRMYLRELDPGFIFPKVRVIANTWWIPLSLSYWKTNKMKHLLLGSLNWYWYWPKLLHLTEYKL